MKVFAGTITVENISQKILRQGYFRPTMNKDAINFVKKCDRCQRTIDIPRKPPEKLSSLYGPWPFSQWGIDLIQPMPVERGQVKYAVVVIDYFIKWA